MKIISGSSNTSLAGQIAKHPGHTITDVTISKFPNGEKRIRINEALLNLDVAIVQSFSHPVDEYIIEVLLLIDAAKRLGPKSIHLVVPWLGYSLQNEVFLEGEPLSIQVVADVLSQTHIDRLYLFDVHKEASIKHFSIPVEHLSARKEIANHIEKHFDNSKLIIASPDVGAMKRSQDIADLLHVPSICLEKSRDRHSGEVSMKSLNASLDNSHVIIVDDGIITGGTLTHAIKTLEEGGVKKISIFATHGILPDMSGIEKILTSVDSLTITNSIEHTSLPKKINVLDISDLFAQTLAASE